MAHGNQHSITLSDTNTISLSNGGIQLLASTLQHHLSQPVTITYAKQERYRLESQGWAGFAEPIFAIHSLRHGGATHDHLNAVFTMEEIMPHGRWKGMECARRYVQDSQGLIMKVAAPNAVSDRLRSMRFLTR